jgi:glyoxylase-like metal-dependent hydrolase (beta-lactamase superfamily II)
MNMETIEKNLFQSFPVAPGVWGKKDLFVNYFMIQDQATGNWALVDAGLKWSAGKIKSMARELFGDTKPVAIVLTHGHFDHVGALSTLVKEWQVPVYAHYLEVPYLTGKSPYPPADPTVGGGMMATISWVYPEGPIDIGEHVRTLPADGSIPGLSEWRFIHTPGHAPGHISLFRESDRVLIAGDAFVTTKAESAIYALSHMKYLSGPPKYFTCNWASAKQSVLKLAGLNPEVAATGHGKPMRGDELRSELNSLASNFDRVAVPESGRYVNEPALTNERGIVSLPKAPEKHTALVTVLGVSLAVLAIGFVVYQQARKKKNVVTELKPKVADLFQMSYN